MPANKSQAPQPVTSKNAEGLIEQEGYGPWPKCELCGEQVEPTEYSLHWNSHISKPAAPPQ